MYINYTKDNIHCNNIANKYKINCKIASTFYSTQKMLTNYDMFID